MSGPSPVWHPFTQHGLDEPAPMVVRAEGAILHTADGQRVIDAISSWWVTTHGHNHPRIVAAIAEQAQRLDQVIFAGWTHEPAEQLARDLVAMMPLRLPTCSFRTGSTSVEVALKMALGYWRQSRRAARAHAGDGAFLSRRHGGCDVGRRAWVFNGAYEPLLFDVVRVPFPAAGCEQADLDALDAACRDPAGRRLHRRTAGAGRRRHADVPRPKRCAKCTRICARHGVLFIADEVMTGWGRTGTLLACEQAGVVPDIAVPGQRADRRLTAARRNHGDLRDLRGTPLDRPGQAVLPFLESTRPTRSPARRPANLAVWREEPVRERVATLAARQARLLAELADIPGAANPRQAGTIIAFDLEDSRGGGYLSDLAPRLMARFREQGVLLRPLGNTIYVMPPYCVEEADLACVGSAIAEAIEMLG